MKVLVNGELKYSSLDMKQLIPERKREFIDLSPEIQEKVIPENPASLTYKLDEYKLPPIITKGLREMDTEELVELGTTRVEKLLPYFKSEEILPEEWFKKGDRVRLFLYLIKTDRIGKIKKAAKLYQKISGYYNFGDVDQLVEGESKDNEEYKELREKLQVVHKQCNTNLLVARYKLKDYSTVISLANIIMETDPSCTKAHFYKGKALYDSEMYKEAVVAINKAHQLEPNNEDVKREYLTIKEGSEKYFSDEKKKFSKLFK